MTDLGLGLILYVGRKESRFVDGLRGSVIDLGLVLTSALIGVAVASFLASFPRRKDSAHLTHTRLSPILGHVANGR